MNNHRKWIRNVVGIAAIIALIGLLLLAHFRQKDQTEYTDAPAADCGSISFDGDLVYEGAGSLDLMLGVITDDGTGKSANDRVTAIITSEGTLAQKIVRYSFTDVSGNMVTEKRNLLLNHYKGPVLKAASQLSLTAADLDDTITVLKAQGTLKAENGYGKDITDSVTCLRKKKYGSVYEMTFSVTNEFSDSISVTSLAHISGTVSDPILTLKQQSVTVQAGSYFDPLEWIESAYDGDTPVPFEDVEIHSPVNVTVPGPYTVTYRLYNADQTAATELSLKVTVQ